MRPCTNGLAAIAEAFAATIAGDRSGRSDALLDRWGPMIAGRGACKLPDGALRFIDSARRAFASHIDEHHARGPCPPNLRQLLPTPNLGPWR